jgi:hypothetical protein
MKTTDALSPGPPPHVFFQNNYFDKPQGASSEPLDSEKLALIEPAVTNASYEHPNAFVYKIRKPNRRKVIDRKEEEKIRFRKNAAYAI